MPYGFAYNGLFVLFDRAPFLQLHSVSGRLGTFSFPQAVVLFGCGVLGRLFPLYNPVHGYLFHCITPVINSSKEVSKSFKRLLNSEHKSPL